MTCLFVAELLCPTICNHNEAASMCLRAEGAFERRNIFHVSVILLHITNKCLNYTTDDWDLGP
ncbi:hypothetical protein D917_06669, partial [Trichinella nativa]